MRLVLLRKENCETLTTYLRVALGRVLALSAVPGHAQDRAKRKTTITFNFVVGNKELKASDYVIESLSGNNALRFLSEDGDVQIAYTVPIETNRNRGGWVTASGRQVAHSTWRFDS